MYTDTAATLQVGVDHKSDNLFSMYKTLLETHSTSFTNYCDAVHKYNSLLETHSTASFTKSLDVVHIFNVSSFQHSSLISRHKKQWWIRQSREAQQEREDWSQEWGRGEGRSWPKTLLLRSFLLSCSALHKHPVHAGHQKQYQTRSGIVTEIKI